MPFGDRRGGRGFGGGGRGFGGGFGGRREGGFGGGRRNFGNQEPKPVKEGEEHTVTITEVSQRGDGIARIKNFVIFVPGTKKDDVVKIRIKEVKGNHALGEVISEGSSEQAEEEAKEEASEESESEDSDSDEEKSDEESSEEKSEESDDEEEFA